MKLEDLGFNPDTGTHNRMLTRTENVFVGILWDHVGRENRIPGIHLAAAYSYQMEFGRAPEEISAIMALYTKQENDAAKRQIRTLHNHLLMMHDQVPILSAAGLIGGYWIAESEEEAAAFFETFRKRGLTGLVKASRGRKAALVDMMQQLSFEFDDLVDQTDTYAGFVRRRVSDPTPIEVVDAFLERMMANPEKFSDGLRKIGQKYGGVLLPKDQLAAVKSKAAELTQLMEGLQIA
jgi:hypothetical protein